MSYLRLVGLAIVAILAISAVAATAASAVEPPPLITYSGSGAFTITQPAAGRLETSNKVSITCKAGNGTGQLGKSQATTAELTVTFTGCEILGVKCTTPGLTAGNIQTTRLLALLIRKEPGGPILIKLHPKAGTAFVVTGTKCAEIVLGVTGAVIGEVTTASDKQTTTVALSFTQSVGLQTDKKGEGETESSNLIATTGGGPEEAGLESAITLALIGGSGQLLP